MRTVVVLTTAKPELLAEMQSDDCYSAGVIYYDMTGCVFCCFDSGLHFFTPHIQILQHW